MVGDQLQGLGMRVAEGGPLDVHGPAQEADGFIVLAVGGVHGAEVVQADGHLVVIAATVPGPHLQGAAEDGVGLHRTALTGQEGAEDGEDGEIRGDLGGVRIGHDCAQPERLPGVRFSFGVAAASVVETGQVVVGAC